MAAQLATRQAESHELVGMFLILVIMNVKQTVRPSGATSDLLEQPLEAVTENRRDDW